MAAQKTRTAQPKNEYEYMYASARVRALEKRLIGREKLERLVECGTTADVLAVLAEYGIAVGDAASDTAAGSGMDQNAREEMLLGILKRAFEELAGAEVPPELLAILRYPYDCNNVKAVLKCRARGVDPTPMLFDFGTVSLDEVTAMPEKLEENRRNANEHPTQSAQSAQSAQSGANPLFDPYGSPDTIDANGAPKAGSLPKHMAAALVEAYARFGETGNPQTVDLLLDKACFADMAEAAALSGCRLAVEAVAAQADLTNLMIAIRLLRMNVSVGGRAFFEETILPGGKLSEDFLLKVFDGGEKALPEALANTPYASFATAAQATDGSLAALERAADDFRMALVQKTRYVSFGPDVPFAYLFANEYAVKNLRIVLAGKDTGLSPEVIRERLRLSYV